MLRGQSALLLSGSYSCTYCRIKLPTLAIFKKQLGVTLPQTREDLEKPREKEEGCDLGLLNIRSLRPYVLPEDLQCLVTRLPRANSTEDTYRVIKMIERRY